MENLDVCRHYAKYSNLFKTLSLGCANCGRQGFHHADACRRCDGTGYHKESDLYDDEKQCQYCGGTGRVDKKLE